MHLDSAAMTTLFDSSGLFIVKVRTVSGNLPEITAPEYVSKTITPDMHGFLIRHGFFPFLLEPIESSSPGFQMNARWMAIR